MRFVSLVALTLAFAGRARAQQDAPSSVPQFLTVIGGNRLVFTADDGIHGRELWATDGEPGHATLIKDIWPGTRGSNPQKFYVLGDRAMFVAETPSDLITGVSQGAELWITDSTTAGTVFLLDSMTGPESSDIRWMPQRDGQAYFGGTRSAETGNELWRSDGSPAGTGMVLDIWRGHDGSQPRHGDSAWLPDGRLMFFAYINSENWLYAFDPSTGAATQIRSARDGAMVLGAIGPFVLLSLYDNAHGWEIWRSDGAPDGTVLLKDISPGGADSSPGTVCPLGSRCLFNARDGKNGAELWVTDGTEAGTMLLKDIKPGVAGSSPYKFTPAGPYAYFVADGVDTGREIWRTDGTVDGTIMLKDINPGPAESEPYALTDLNGVLLFGARTAEHGEELWASDGTPQGTRLVKDIYPGPGPECNGSPYDFAAMGPHVYFHATTREQGVELWRSDGTEAGTVLVDDIWKEYLVNPSSNPHALTNADGTLYFAASDIEHGTELWRMDETAGPIMVRDIFSGPASSGPHNLTPIGNRIFFGADDGTHGDELWQSDGTLDGTALVADYARGDAHSGPKEIVRFRDTAYFASWRAEDGEELRMVAGSSAIDRVFDIAQGPASSNPRNLLVVRNLLYFCANDGVHGDELWASNGMSYGTYMVYDLLPRADIGAAPSGLTVIERRLFFAANDGAHGTELWSIDDDPRSLPSLTADIANAQSLTPLTASRTEYAR